jgi:predicted Zn-ribbon and HTH transcriptional regulator
VPEYSYYTANCHGTKTTDFVSPSDFGDRKMNGLVNKYFNETVANYRKALVKVSKIVSNLFKKYDESTPLDRIQDDVYLAIVRNWDEQFIQKQVTISENNVDKIYSHFRNDKSVFGKKAKLSGSKDTRCPECQFEFEYNSIVESGMGYVECPNCHKSVTQKSIFNREQFANGDPIPEPVFDLLDFRTIDYLSESDALYLGKFITDEGTKKKIRNYLEEQYIKGELPLGGETKVLNKFQNEFERLLNLESWKIRRVIDTSVNNARNDGNVMYMNQAKIEKYEIIEIQDQLTCDWCSHMDGMEFTINNAVSKIQNKVDVGPENVSRISPFATSIPIEEFQGMDAAAIEGKNITTPSYHPSCRGRVVAVI